jgi:predicted PurR-regulated permease PerM
VTTSQHAEGDSTNSDEAAQRRPLGEVGAPFSIAHPFYFGFIGALGALVAITMARAFASASQIFVLIVISLFFAMGLNPPIEFLRRRGLSRPIAVLVMLLAILIFVTLFSLLVIPPIIAQSNQLISSAPELINQLKSNPTFAHLNDQYGFLDSIQERVTLWVQDGKFVLTAFGGIVGVGKVVLSGAFAALTIFILTLYFIASLPQITKIAYRIAPASRRDRFAKISDAIIARIGTFVGSQILVAFMAALFVTILSVALKLPYAISLGMFIFVCALIPLVGHFVGAAIVTLVAFSQSPTRGLIALVAYIAYQQIENYLIVPRIMKRNLAIPGIVTIIAALIGTSLLGLVGALLAVPIAAAVLLIIDEVVLPSAEQK